MSSRARIGIVVGAVVVLVVAFIIINGSGGDDGDQAGKTPVVTVKDAKPVGGIQKLKFAKGDQIRFTVVSDTADEIHFHGYDIGQDVKAGGSTTFDVKATIEGRFEVELEDHGQQIAEVEVDPS